MLVRKKRTFSSQISLLLSTSGGQDSACLTAIMAQLQRQWGNRLGTVACNHLWQDDSFYSSFHIARVCFLLKQSFCFVPISHQPTLNNEGKARVWRQNTIQRLAFFYQYPAICTGHTSSDRVETMLFNLIRGSGKKGLSSLYWSRFLKASYPELCYLSNFNGTAPDQKERFAWPAASILSKEKKIPLYQACVLCKCWRAALPSRISWSTFCSCLLLCPLKNHSGRMRI